MYTRIRSFFTCERDYTSAAAQVEVIMLAPGTKSWGDGWGMRSYTSLAALPASQSGASRYVSCACHQAFRSPLDQALTAEKKEPYSSRRQGFVL